MSDQNVQSQSDQSSTSELQKTCVRRPADAPPFRKKTRLIDLFNRVSIATNPDECTKVYLRVKPFTDDEDSSQKCLKIITEQNAVQTFAPDSSHAFRNSTRGLGKSSLEFTFSKVFDESTKQADFFNGTMLEMTKQFVGGQNSLVFSYGVTSSGKTYTIQGKPQDGGILPRSLDVLFNSINGKQISNPRLKPEMFNDVVRLSAEDVLAEQKIKKQTLKMGVVDDPTMMSLMGDEMESVLSDTAMSSSSGMEELLADVVNRDREKLKVDVEEKMRFGVWVSFAEVYNEQVYDLLVPVPSKKKLKRTSLRICDDRNGNPYIRGLKEIHVESADEAYKLLMIGQRNLMTACTRLNHCSSRSHSIFNIKVVRVVDKEDPHIACVSTLSLCDLAGSERYSKTQATGDRLKEAGNINTSLMTLGRCIETLRHNQLHRDQQRLVPFRDSKLTRILQNFFNGCGKAAMIVNVSQAASMFDDTLHVFKFSAIAKQVKYEKPPEEKKPQKVKKAPPPLLRRTIEWESKESKADLEEAENLPLPDDDDDEFSDSEILSTSEEMRKYIESLEHRVESLIQLLADEMSNADNKEERVRQEVISSMQKQMVIVEENYSAMLRNAREEAEELADERAKGIMEIYEKRLERIQTKMDEDDEWVSSLLYHQEKTKVEEQEAKIIQLEKKLEESRQQTVNDSVEMGNSVLVETLTHKLQEAKDEIACKDDQISELKLLLEEAGETYTTLKEKLAKEEKTSQQLTSQIADKEKEFSTQKEELLGKLKSKDTTITSLEEECKELQEEIERLQDQMSQIDEQSRCQQDLESSTVSEKNVKSKNILNVTESSLSGDVRCNSPQLKIGKENICEVDTFTKTKQTNKELMDDIARMKSELQERHEEIVSLKVQNETLESSHTATMKEKNAVSKELDICQQSLDKTVKELETSKEVLEENVKDLNKAKDTLNVMEEDMKQLQKQKNDIASEKKLSEVALAELTTKFQELEEKYGNLKTVADCPNQTTEIIHMVQMIEEKTSPQKSSSKVRSPEEEDEEVVFKLKTVPQTPNERTHVGTPSLLESSSADLAVKLKDAELANAALRSKLKHEEEDYFKREQALIHGYTAEIDSLKYEMAKVKTKVDNAAGGRSQRGKKRALMDISSCSSTSELCPENVEEKGPCPLRLENVMGNPEQVQSVAILSNEIIFLQEQLASLTAAYKDRERHERNGNAKSIKQEIKSVSKAARYSNDTSYAARCSLTNSVLLFEKEECSIKFEEMSNRVAQLEAENKSLNDQLEQQKNAVVEANKQNQRMVKVEETECCDSKLQVQISSEKLHTVTRELEDAYQMHAEIKEALSATVASKDKFQMELKEKDITTSHLQETIDTMLNEKNKLVKELERNSQKIEALNADNESLLQKIAEITHERDLAQKDCQLSKEQLSSAALQMEVNDNKKRVYETEAEEKGKQLKLLNARLAQVEQTSDTTKKELETKDAQNKILEDRCRDLEKSLLEKENSVKENEKRLHLVEERLTTDCQSKSGAISAMQQEISQLSSQLEEKSKALARIESLRQEEAAESAQKIISLEKQKKLAERRAAEACSREEEIQIHYQSLDMAKQELDKLKVELHQVNLQMKEKEALNEKLKEDLALTSEEVKRQREIENAVVLSKKDSENLKAKLFSLEQKLDMERQEYERALKETEDLLYKVKELKTELSESEKTMDKQEEVLTKQDEEIKDLKMELESSKMERNRLDKDLTRKDIELANLNKQISKSSEETKALEEIKFQNNQLKENAEKTKEELKSALQKLEETEIKLTEMMDDKTAVEKNLQKQESINERHREEMEAVEKNLRKQESINERHREEMEHMKMEKDSCIKKLEQRISKLLLEEQQLKEEVDKLKKSNAELAQEAVNITQRKDAFISELKKSNNTMSIHLADAQGLSPPPKMATPEMAFPGHFEEDVDTSGHLEIDVTPSAARRGKKRQTSLRSLQSHSSSVDFEPTPDPKCLKTIKEESESPASSSSKSPRARVAELASEVIATLSPLRRATSRKQSNRKKMQPPFKTADLMAISTETESPVTRRSSRLRSQTSKHSLV